MIDMEVYKPSPYGLVFIHAKLLGLHPPAYHLWHQSWAGLCVYQFVRETDKGYIVRRQGIRNLIILINSCSFPTILLIPHHVYNPQCITTSMSSICNIAFPRTLYQCSAVQGTRVIMLRVVRYAGIPSNQLHNFYRRCPSIKNICIVELINIFLYIYTISNCQSLPLFLLNWNMSLFNPAHSVWVEWPIRSDVTIFDN